MKDKEKRTMICDFILWLSTQSIFLMEFDSSTFKNVKMKRKLSEMLDSFFEELEK